MATSARRGATQTAAMNPNDPNSTAQKTGLSGLAIAGIGCGALLLIVLVVVGITVAKIAGKVREVAGDFQKNPLKTGAMLVAKANPDWDIVKTDDAAGEITVRDKRTGEVTTMSFNEVAQGKFRMTNSKGEETTVDASGADGGKVVIKGPDGETVFGGDAAATAPPAWVPGYPGAQAQFGGMKTERLGVVSGTFTAQTADAPAKVREFFEAKLKADGYEVTVAPDTESPVISAKKDGGKRAITVLLTGGKPATQLAVTYEGPKEAPPAGQ